MRGGGTPNTPRAYLGRAVLIFGRYDTSQFPTSAVLPLLVVAIFVDAVCVVRYDTALNEVESPVTTWVLALGSYL